MGVAENQTHSNFYGSPFYLQMRKIHSKMKVLEWSQQISHCKPMQIFMMLKGCKLHSLKHIQAFMSVLVTCMNEEDPIKNEGARVVSTLFINF